MGKPVLERCPYPALREAMELAGIKTGAELCRQLELGNRAPELREMLLGKIPARKRNLYGAQTGEWTVFSVKIAEYFGTTPEGLFSEKDT